MAVSTRQIDKYHSQPPIFLQGNRPLGAALHTLYQQHRAYFLDVVKLGEAAPAESMTLAEWSRPEMFLSLVERYGDELYRNHPQHPREAKPLQSLWAQWYCGLIVPPLMMAMLLEPRVLDCSVQHIHVQFHSTGRPAQFWIDIHEDGDARSLTSRQRLERLIQQHLIPVVKGIEQHGAINGKLIWNNTGYLMHWFLGEIRTLLGEETFAVLEQALLFAPQLLDGSDNPLYRTMLLREGELQRRSCCQRYRVPDIERCGNCTLKPV
ncbi:ferric iron reductase protein [Paramixta manurensis]|uniref:Ferric iron reductase protein n=1 Tax=Paramixta manurensis TaxID=2740817 RepID=A0A6M8U4V3_9GAMM|nr:ferric iron reductase protein [Erwiniaceae bacterium PD-1]